MFTLKLFYRTSAGTLVTKIQTCHRVEVREFKDVIEDCEKCAIELWIFDTAPGFYESVCIGEITEERRSGKDGVWYGWGLLENMDGKTTQHFRPASYG